MNPHYERARQSHGAERWEPRERGEERWRAMEDEDRRRERGRGSPPDGYGDERRGRSWGDGGRYEEHGSFERPDEPRGGYEPYGGEEPYRGHESFRPRGSHGGREWALPREIDSPPPYQPGYGDRWPRSRPRMFEDVPERWGRDPGDGGRPWTHRDVGREDYRGEPGEGLGRGRHAGKGPKGYRRSDERIREEVCERMRAHPELDATECEVEVQGGEVTLKGTVASRREKRLAEDCCEDVPGVDDVHNQMRIAPRESGGESERKRASSASRGART